MQTKKINQPIELIQKKYIESIKWVIYSGFIFLILAFIPATLHAATYNINVGISDSSKLLFYTQSSSNPADVNTNKITISPGDSITWTWVDPSNSHTVTSTDGASPGVACSSGDSFDTGSQSNGHTFSHTFNTVTPSGNPCKFYCTIHASPSAAIGMVGFITVAGPAGDFSLAASPTSATVTPGASTTPSISVNSLSGFNSSVALSCLTSDPSVGCSLNPVSVTPPANGSASSTMTVTTQSSTAAGPYTVTVTGASSNTTHTTTFTLNVGASGGGAAGPTNAVTTGFFDTNTTPDVVVANSATKKIQLYPTSLPGNISTSTFSMTDASIPQHLATGKFNTNVNPFDGLAVLDQFSSTDPTTFISVYFGSKNGTFPTDSSGNGSPSTRFYVPNVDKTAKTITSIAAADVNGDGKTDLIVTIAPATPSGDPTPMILLGNGDGTFQGTLPFTGPIVTYQLSITLGGNGNGTVTSSPSGINCGSTCSAFFGNNTPVTLTATPASGSQFTTWGGACSGTNPSFTITISGAAASCTASFTKIVGSVTVTPSSASIQGGFTQQYTATAFDIFNNPITGLTFTWGTSDSTICTVDPTGLARGVIATGGGPVTISASTGGKTGTATCTVTPSQTDISATSVSAFISGTTIYITNTVTNSGKNLIGSVDIGFYVSPDGTIAHGTFIGSRTVTNLGVGASNAASTAITLQNIPTGTYQVGMYADYNNQLVEINRTNNVLFTTGTFLIGPDLTFYSLQGQISGATILVSDTTQNIGNESAGSFTNAYYFSTTATLNPSAATLIGTRTIASLAGGGQTNSLTTQFAIPSTTVLPIGTYYLCALTNSTNSVVETNTANNTSCTTGTFVISPDLTVYPNGISGSIAGGSIYVTDTEQNIGDQNAASFAVSFYFSTSTTLNPSTATLIGSRTITGLAGGGMTNSATTVFTIPGPPPIGTFHLCALTNSTNSVPELNTSNNTQCTAATFQISPDLAVYSVNASKSGSNIFVSDTEQNLGDQPAGAFTVTFYVSTITTLDSTAIPIGSRNITSLGAGGATNSATNSYPVPTGISPGNYYVIAFVDSGSVIPELNKTNNIKATSTTLSLP